MSNENTFGEKRFVAPLFEVEDVITKSVENGGSFSMITAGCSMLPLLRNRMDKVILVKAEHTLKRYDIPLYKCKDGHFVLHRIVKIKKDGYVMCGDNQLIFEKGIDDSNVIAVVSEIIRKGKRIDLKKSFRYKVYVFFWCRCYFIRWLVLHFKSVLGKLFKNKRNS